MGSYAEAWEPGILQLLLCPEILHLQKLKDYISKFLLLRGYTVQSIFYH
jgi:hypothetical protein